MTFGTKISYNVAMLERIVFLILRILLIAAFWAFAWRFVEPRTQGMRILRATLLVLGLLAILAVVRTIGP